MVFNWRYNLYYKCITPYKLWSFKRGDPSKRVGLSLGVSLHYKYIDACKTCSPKTGSLPRGERILEEGPVQLLWLVCGFETKSPT